MSKELMLALPEVAYFVDRIPVGRVVVKANPIQLRFFQHARDSNMSLKDQCRLLGVPWHARKIRAGQVSQKALEVAKATAASVFVQALPTENVAAKQWIDILHDYRQAREDIRHWLAFHALDVREAWADVRCYLNAPEITVSPSLAPKTLIERAKEFVAEQQKAIERRYAELNMAQGQFRAIDLAHVHDATRYQYELARQQLQQQAYNNQYQNMLMAGMQNAYGGPLGAAPDRPRQVADMSPVAYDAKLLEPLEHGDYIVQLLNTHEQFSDEGKRMHHCVEQYFPRAKMGACRIVSVTKKALLGAKKVATAEYTADWELIQAKGPANSNVGGDVHIVTALRAFGAAKKQLALAPT